MGRAAARSRVVKVEEIGLDVPVICRQCEERYCLRCPEQAVSIGRFGEIVVSPTVCTSCRTCERLCPVGAIELFREIPYVCDLCGGEPRCVTACTLGAIRYTPDKTETISLADVYHSVKGRSPADKRLHYARMLWEAAGTKSAESSGF